MAKTGGGSIVNISSIVGFVGGASGHPAYSASKGAVRIYTKSAAVRYGPLGIRVSPDAPTPFEKCGLEAMSREERLALMGARPFSGTRLPWLPSWLSSANSARRCIAAGA
jgi:NAD(P)-dependent dehydrogenase (short-subunit alcohol dehydrogenase family)